MPHVRKQRLYPCFITILLAIVYFGSRNAQIPAKMRVRGNIRRAGTGQGDDARALALMKIKSYNNATTYAMLLSKQLCHDQFQESPSILVTLTVGNMHLDMVGDLMAHVRDIQLKDKRVAFRADFMLLHWDKAENEQSIPGEHSWWWNGVPGLFQVTHKFRKGFVKLDFSRHTLTPDIICPYEYIFLWDGDVVLSQEYFSFFQFASIMKKHGLDMATPTFDSDSFVSYELTKSQGHEIYRKPREHWRLEIGFWVFHRRSFLSFRALMMSGFEFKYWWVDTLPFQCVIGAERLALLDSMVVHHSGKEKQKKGYAKVGKTLSVNRRYTIKEKHWRDQIIQKYHCCDYMKLAKLVYHDENPEFFKCHCNADGFRC